MNNISSEKLSLEIYNHCSSKKEEALSLLQKLIAIPSEFNSKNSDEEIRTLGIFLKKTLENEIGIKTTIHGKGENTVIQGTLGSGKRALLLNCPLDTAPAGNISKWKHPPYKGVIENGKIYGRGAADCKAGMISMICAVGAIKTLTLPKNLRVEIVFDGGEHNGSYAGMHNILEKGLDVEAGIVGYAGQKHEIQIGARGYHRYAFIVEGKSAHTGSRRNMGLNAISKTIRLISELENTKLPEPKNKLFDFGSRLTFSIIEGGRAINIVPDECRTELDVRTTPEQSKKDIDALIKKAIQKVQKEDKGLPITFTYTVGEEGYILKGDEKIIHAIKSAATSVLGKVQHLVVSGPAHIGNLLYKNNIPVVIKGPIGANHHGYDEYVEIESIPKTAQIYAETILTYFGLLNPKKDSYEQ